jgi:hypothetical protein
VQYTRIRVRANGVQTPLLLVLLFVLRTVCYDASKRHVGFVDGGTSGDPSLPVLKDGLMVRDLLLAAYAAVLRRSFPDTLRKTTKDLITFYEGRLKSNPMVLPSSIQQD